MNRLLLSSMLFLGMVMIVIAEWSRYSPWFLATWALIGFAPLGEELLIWHVRRQISRDLEGPEIVSTAEFWNKIEEV